METKVLCLVQARMGSSRLPGKVLELIDGRPMIQWVLERTALARHVDAIVVATTTLVSDDVIAHWCAQRQYACHRGPENDVLQRFCDALQAQESKPDIVVRLTADCPFTDPQIIDECVSIVQRDPAVGYAASRRPESRTFPLGIDVEVFRAPLLLDAELAGGGSYRREHVTPWFYDGGYGGKTTYLDAEENHSRERWTVDSHEDLEFVRAVAPRLKSTDWRAVLSVVRDSPELREINCNVRQKSYRQTN